MLSEGLWEKARKRKQHRKRRERRAHFGELVQMDGSFHDWYERRAGKACLMNMVDDATSATQARLGKEETIWAAAGVLRGWIRKYGGARALAPRALAHGRGGWGRFCSRWRSRSATR